MNELPRIETILDDWMSEEGGRWPDRSVDAVLATIDHTPQRRAWRAPWRTPQMTPTVRLVMILAATTLLALFIAGIALVGGQRATVTVPPESSALAVATAPPATSAPVPSPTATPRPTPTLAPVPLGLAIVGLDGSVRTDLGLPRGAWAPDLSADGSKVAFIEGGRLWTADATQGSTPVDTGASVVGRVPAFSSFAVDAAPAWSPDGTRIAYVSDGDIYVLDVGSTSAPRRLTTSPTLDEWPAWSPDGRTVYYINEGATLLDGSAMSATQELWRVPAAGGSPRRVTHDDTSDLQPDVANDGSMVIWQGGGIARLDPARGRASDLVNPANGSAIGGVDGWNPRLSPDRRKLAYLSWQGARTGVVDAGIEVPQGLPLMEVHVLDLTTGRTIVVGPRVAAFWNPVSWTPDGTGLLVDRYDAGP